MARPDWLTDTVIGVVIGSIGTILGGIIGSIIQARLARNTTMQTEIGRRRVEAIGEGYWRMKHAESLYGEDILEPWSYFNGEFGEWFFKNFPFLPPAFSHAWINIRARIRREYNIRRGTITDEKEQQLDALGDEIQEYIKQALLALESETGVKELRVVDS